jgi:ribokinase
MTQRRIVVVGSSNTDMTIRLGRIPQPGETLLGGEFLMAAGGKGANQAVGAARSGGHVSLVARVGADIFGDQVLAGLREDRIDVTHVYRDRQAASGVALIFVGERGENSIAVASGANARLSPADVRKAGGVIAAARVLLLQLEVPLASVQAAALLGARSGARVILNPAPARELPDSLLRRVSILTPNETEAAMLTGIHVRSDASAARAAARLHARGVPTVIVTLGARGALVANQDGTHMVPGFKVNAVDTTAAGDIFNGALAVALAEDVPLPQAVRFASAAAAISVTRRGAQLSAPQRPEIDRLLRRAAS